jgi:hypothetical protein
MIQQFRIEAETDRKHTRVKKCEPVSSEQKPREAESPAGSE